MTKVSLALIALGLFSLGCDGRNPTAPADDRAVGPQFAARGVVHRATAGSHDITPPGVDANYSLVAIEHADGRISGQYTDRFAEGGGFHARVTCLAVSGKDAWISGVVTTPEEFEGLTVITRVQDNGTSEHEPPDQISFSFIGVPPEFQDCHLMLPLPLFPLDGGEVKVE
jgi:hypothetical protein